MIGLLLVFGPGLSAQNIFNDDFERARLGALWNGNGGWSIQGGQAYNGSYDNGSLLTTATSFDATSYVLETEIFNLVEGYWRQYHLFFGQQDDSGAPGYIVTYDPLGPGTAILGRSTDSYLYPTVLDRHIIDLDPTQRHRIRVEKYETGLIQVYFGDESGFPGTPDLEAVDTTFATLAKVSWSNFTQSAGEEFFVEYIRADAPDTQKTNPEKPADDELIEQVIARSDTPYEVGQLNVGETFYTDRPYTIVGVPGFLTNAKFIKTANNDKWRADDDFLDAFITEKAIAYVAYDPRASVLPEWLSDWTKTDAIIETTDPGSDYLEVYTKVVQPDFFSPTPYRLRLGASLAAPAVGANMNYIVAVVPIESSRYEAEEAFLSGAKVASNRPGFSGTGFGDFINPSGDYIEWTVDVAATSPYALLARYANGSLATRQLELSVDGVVVSTEDFRSTFGWFSWASRTLLNSILLEAGIHTVRLTAIGNSGPNVDYLQLTPTSTAPGNLAKAAPSTASPSPRAFGVDAATLVVTAYPNPTVNELTFELSGLPEAGEMRILDMRGHQLYRRVLANTGNTPFNRQRVEVADWPVGTYIYQVSAGHRVVTGKFMKGR